MLTPVVPAFVWQAGASDERVRGDLAELPGLLDEVDRLLEIGVIVHRKRQLEDPIQPTEHHNILRATIQRLPDLLLAKRLPGQRPSAQTERS